MVMQDEGYTKRNVSGSSTFGAGFAVVPKDVRLYRCNKNISGSSAFGAGFGILSGEVQLVRDYDSKNIGGSSAASFGFSVLPEDVSIMERGGLYSNAQEEVKMGERNKFTSVLEDERKL